MPKVSVVIPVYNVERYLGECLDSILGQTLKDLEVLCVDDASTDSSLRILEDYAARDSRVKVLRAEHGGAFKARKVGVGAATGEYLYFMDADDLLEPRTFEELCARMDRDRLDQLVFAASVFCEDDVSAHFRRWAKRMTRYYSLPKALCGRVMDGMSLMSALMDRNSFHVSPPLRLLRTSIVRENEYGFPDATTRADNYFTPISLHFSRRACAIDVRYYRRRVRNGSITNATGAEARHFRNLFMVILGLYRFKPFAAAWADPRSPVTRLAMGLVSGINTWAWKLPAERRSEILDEVLSGASAEERVFLANLLLMDIRELRRRPEPMLASAFGFIGRRLVRMLKGRGSGWHLR